MIPSSAARPCIRSLPCSQHSTYMLLGAVHHRKHRRRRSTERLVLSPLTLCMNGTWECAPSRQRYVLNPDSDGEIIGLCTSLRSFELEGMSETIFESPPAACLGRSILRLILFAGLLNYVVRLVCRLCHALSLS